MKLALIILALSLPLSAESISREVHAAVMQIADDCGVPRSVANALQIEESGWYKTGTWGDAKAVNHGEPGGWESRGLYQLYYKPSNIEFLLSHYWTSSETFNVFNPLHNATVALRYLADLHKRHGTWLAANAYYNGGSAYSWERAKRIIEAREP